ncbi:S8 family serine peptidase [Lutibacter sp. B1]|uniref:S8 family serine peptidase n=1 Tax=Lutibacter sp. B1 TaxID=2725996 RepID=UPI0035303743
MKAKLLTYLLLFSLSNIVAQVEDAWVYFKNKPNEATFIQAPLTMLSQRAIDRRTRFNIPIDYIDVPIEVSYINQVKNSNGIVVKATSKWLNALHVQGNQEDINNLKSLNFVSKIEYADRSLNSSSKNRNKQKNTFKNDKLKFTTDFNYGNATNQIEMLKGTILHQNNFTGEGMQIAVIDGGFIGVDNFKAFERIRNNNQILGGYNFVERNDDLYVRDYHGMAVLSTIAGYLENEFTGTSPDAQFYLFISEDSTQEVPLEESLWIEAAEKADSLGVDIINTSLGYTTFDNVNYNHLYEDLDGKTTFITRGAEIAFSRGIIVVNSAGNEGNSTWNYISAPADASSVLTIGAVNSESIIANFSSYGPTFDNRIKPDVCAQGEGVYIIDSSGNIATSNGTSFSSPIIAGMTACLWQAFPTKTNTEIIQLIKESAHLYESPINQEGYGIPNFETIYSLLESEEIANNVDFEFVYYPNPANEELKFKFPAEVEEFDVEIYTILGVEILQNKVTKNNPSIPVSNLTQGLYFVHLKLNDKLQKIKIFKN